MASLIRRPNSPFWFACFSNKEGRRLKRSTKLLAVPANRRAAQRLAEDFEDEFRTVRVGHQARKVLADIQSKYLPASELVALTVRQFFEAHVVRKRPEVSQATIEYYEGNARRFLAWLGTGADKGIAALAVDTLLAYRSHLLGKSSPRTVNNVIKCLKTFFAAALKDGHIAEDPCSRLDLVRDRTESPRRPFAAEEIQRLLAVADEEWKSMILMGLHTGQRLKDISLLEWKDYDAEKKTVRFKTSKTGRMMTLPLLVPLKWVEGTHMHPRAADIVVRHGRIGSVSKGFAELLLKAGLREEKVARSARVVHELSFHSLRHTATSWLREAGIPDSVVMEFIGHDDRAVSQGYTHTGMDALKAAAAAISGRLS